MFCRLVLTGSASLGRAAPGRPLLRRYPEPAPAVLEPGVCPGLRLPLSSNLEIEYSSSILSSTLEYSAIPEVVQRSGVTVGRRPSSRQTVTSPKGKLVCTTDLTDDRSRRTSGS